METQKKALLFITLMIAACIFLLLTGPLVYLPNLPTLMVEIFGVLLILWAVIARKVSKHDHSDKLPKGYFLIQTGPYEIIRHPIYAGILLITLSLLEYEYTFLRLIAFLILLFAVILKVLREENILEQKMKDYAEYKRKTKKLIPYLF